MTLRVSSMQGADSPINRRQALRVLALGAAGSLGLAFVGCSSTSQPASPGAAPSSAPAAGPSSGPASGASPVASAQVAPAQASGGAPGTWDDLVAAGQKEGTVVVSGPPDPGADTKVPDAFKQAYGIDLQYLAGNSGQMATRIQSERAAGQYTIDVSVAGVDTAYSTLLANGWLDPLKPALLKPDVIDPSVWRPGAPWFRDPSGAAIMQILNSVSPALLTINTQSVTADQLTDSSVLLQPQWKGKIGAYNPSVSGSGLAIACGIYLAKGADYAQQLFINQSVALTQDYNQLADWVAHGTYPICIGVSHGNLEQYYDAGIPIQEINLPDVPPETGGAFGLINLYNHAPHPNAARVFSNWLASKDGLTLFGQLEGAVPVRNDIDPTWSLPSAIPEAGVQYFDSYEYTFATSQREQIRQYFAGLLK